MTSVIDRICSEYGDPRGNLQTKHGVPTTNSTKKTAASDKAPRRPRTTARSARARSDVARVIGGWVWSSHRPRVEAAATRVENQKKEPRHAGVLVDGAAIMHCAARSMPSRTEPQRPRTDRFHAPSSLRPPSPEGSTNFCSKAGGWERAACNVIPGLLAHRRDGHHARGVRTVRPTSSMAAAESKPA